MYTKKVRLISAAVAGGLVLTGVTTAAIAGTGQTPTSRILAADTASAVNLDNCPTLAEGYHGGCVNQLQTELNADDGSNLTVDGTFGPATRKAVEIFQQERNIVPADGIVGPQTKAALDNLGSNPVATPAPAPSAGSPTPVTSPSSVNAVTTTQVVDKEMSECGLIDIGVSGTCVITVQRWLNRLDNAALTVDGSYGPTTQEAVITFQGEHGLTPDGQVDEKTKQMLRSQYTDYLVGDLPTTAPDYDDQLMLRQMAELMCNAVGRVMAFPTVGMPAGGALVDLFTKQYVDGCITGTYSMPSFSDVIKAVTLSAMDIGLEHYFGPVFDDLFAGLQPATEELGGIASSLWNNAILDRIEEAYDKSAACYAANGWRAAWCSYVPVVSALERQVIH